MTEIVELTASPFALSYCERFREDISNCLTDSERNATPEENYRAKVAELEVGRFLRMKWSVLEMLLNSTLHHDVISQDGLKGDIKASMAEGGNTLFWPRDKWQEFGDRDFDWLGFCNTHRFPIIEFRGFVFKDEFQANHKIAGADHHLKDRTPYWPNDKPLRHPSELGRPPLFDDDHHCTCGEYGCFSSDFGKTWYCAEHNPDREQQEKRLAAAYEREEAERDARYRGT